MRQARQIGVKAQFASGDGVSNDTFIELASDASNGYLYTDAFDSSNPPTAKSKAFVEAYTAESGESNVPGFTALGADSYYLMVDAMNRCADAADRECVNKEIKNSKNFEGVSGIINIDKKGNAERSIVIKEIAGGKAMYKDTVNPK